MKILSIIIFLLIIATGCRYKEGPMISFRSVEKRLTGTWQIVELTSDGVDSLKYYNDSCGCKMRIGSFYYQDGTLNNDVHIFLEEGKHMYEGGLSLSDNKKIINVNFIYTQPTVIGPFGRAKSDWKILKLTMNKLKVSIYLNGRNYIISFKK